MSKGTQDKDYKPKHRIITKRRTPGRNRQKVEPIEYLGYESEGSLGDISVHLGFDTLEEQAKQGEQYLEYVRGEIDRQDMAKQTEKSSMDKMLEMFMRMRKDDRKEREQERQLRQEEMMTYEEKRDRENREKDGREKTERIARENRLELDRLERENRREEERLVREEESTRREERRLREEADREERREERQRLLMTTERGTTSGASNCSNYAA